MQEESPSLIKGKKLPPSMDYDFLRRKAIDLTQQISGKKWTDYNIHDPGITILEQFCFALTDIAYRTNLSIETLLFHEGDREKIKRNHALFTAEEIFPTGPITLDDYRILILDKFPNKISNCWVNKLTDHRDGIQGLYSVLVLPKNDVPSLEYTQLKDDIRTFLGAHRNLCEDFEEIKFLQPQRICISADIDIRPDASAEEVLAEMLFQVEYYFNPTVKFYAFEELEKTGMALEDIFDTPSFQHGFITKRDLRPKQQEFYVSKIANYILNVKGVRNLRNLHVTVDGLPLYGDIIEVPEHKYLTLGFLGNHFDVAPFKGFKLSLYKGGALSSYTEEGVIYSLELKEARTHRSYQIRTDLQKAKAGAYRTHELLSYESIQKTFPGIYGVGDYTPANEEGKERKAQSAQLKAYLIFFDQIMANHLAQLTKIAEIFTIQEFDQDNIKTYYAQLLDATTPGADELIKKKFPAKSSLLKQISTLENFNAHLSDKEKKELDELKLDLLEKELLVRELVVKEFDALQKLADQTLKRKRTFENRTIILLISQYNKLIRDHAQAEDQDENDFSFKKELAKRIKEIQDLMIEEWMEKEHWVDFKAYYSDALIKRYDSSIDRKNRILTHYLARFGEQFTTDFQLKFSTLLEGESQETINKKLIALKSSFLKEINHLNRYRSRGFNYSDVNPLEANSIPFKRKISFLLNIEHQAHTRITAAELKNKLTAKRLANKDIIKVTQPQGKIVLRPAQNTTKLTFLVNSNNYYRYIFKYGLKKKNYSIAAEDGKYAVYFFSSRQEDAMRLFELPSKEEANQKVDSLIQLLKELNGRFEGFHILEHILLRPLEGVDCHFLIKSKSGAVIFESKEARPQDVQSKVAFDTLLLACYSTNYRILQNLNKEYVVIIKNQIGKELAKSTETFITEIGAQNFIEQSLKFFNDHKQADKFDKLFELDNDRKYHFILLNDKKEPFIHSIDTADIKTQEEEAKDILITAMYSSKYVLNTEPDDTYSVYLLNTRNVKVARSKANFINREKAEEFIRKSIMYFENLQDSKSIIQYRRLNGRSADEYNAQISIIYPDWTARFSNQEFLQLFKQTVFNCAPAHLAINIIGLNYAEMSVFEEYYFDYVSNMATDTAENRGRLEKLSTSLLNIIMKKVS